MAKSTIKANLISGLQTDVRTLQELVETLREQLRDHGRHTALCASLEEPHLHAGKWVRYKCDCGWTEVSKALSE